MNLKMPVQSRSVASIVAALALGVTAIYLIPFHVPVHDWSVSYVFGFSNRAAIVVFLSFALGFALWTRGLGLNLPDPQRGRGFSSARIRNLAVVSSVLGCVFIWILSQPVAAMGEAQYFLDRYDMARTGARIYQDFTFDYGPLMFYPALWIARVGHLSVANAHYLAWALQWALGTWILWKVVESAAADTEHGRTIFLLLWGFFLPSLTDSGPNYTPLRFAGTLCLALAVCNLYARGASNFVTFGLAVAGASVLLFYSPEQGIAFTFGTILFFLICVRPTNGRTMVGVACFVVGVTGVAWAALKVGVLNNIHTVGGGALNLPLIFSYQTLVLLILLIVSACVWVAAFRQHRSGHPLVYLLCLSLASLPAAFSHVDAGHIIINTLGALIATLVVLSQYPSIWRWTVPAFAIALLLAGYGHLRGYPDWLRAQARTAAFGQQCHSSRAEKIYIKFIRWTKSPDAAAARINQLRADEAREVEPDASHLPSGTRLFAPMGIERRIGPFQDDPDIVSGRYPVFPFITAPAFVDEKIAELKSYSDWPILLSAHLNCEIDPAGLRQGVKRVLFVPYMPVGKHQVSVAMPFCEYVHAHYIQSTFFSPVPGSSIWVPAGSTAAIAGKPHQ
jgi:hypothetical protein